MSYIGSTDHMTFHPDMQILTEYKDFIDTLESKYRVIQEPTNTGEISEGEMWKSGWKPLDQKCDESFGLCEGGVDTD